MRLDLVGRARPVLGREGVHGERVDPEIDRRLDGPAERPRAFAVTLRDRQAARRRPPPVAVHDDRDAPCAAACAASLRGQRQTSMISASFTFKRSSIDFDVVVSDLLHLLLGHGAPRRPRRRRSRRAPSGAA